MHFFSNLFW